MEHDSKLEDGDSLRGKESENGGQLFEFLRHESSSSSYLLPTLSCSLLLTRICEMASPFIQSLFPPHSASSSSPLIVVVDSFGLGSCSFFTSVNAPGEFDSMGSSVTSTISLD